MPPEPQSISLLTSLDQQRWFSPEDVSCALQHPAQLASTGSLRGKTSTRLYLSEQHALKYNIGHRFENNIIERWLAKRIDADRATQLYHPSKTWGYFKYADGQCQAFNISRRLTTIDKVITLSSNPEQKLTLLTQLLTHYLKAYFEQQRRPDEGLSNYGLDTDGTLYYLDDDLYSCDHFNALGLFLAGILRSQAWMTDALAQQLGLQLCQQLQHYDDAHLWAPVIKENLDSSFIPPASQSVLQAMQRGLLSVFHTPETKKNIRLEGKMAILADIHANQPALEQVQQWLADNNIQRSLILGDIVGYGPDPGFCIEQLRQMSALIIKGNHDHAIASDCIREGFSSNARWAAQWTSQQLSPEDKSWLGNLYPVLKQESIWAVHGAPRDPTFFNAYVYERTYESNLDFMQQQGITLCFHGHTHMPGIYSRLRKGKDRFQALDKAITLERDAIHLICPGSIGQARNGSRQAQFLVFDFDELSLLPVWLEYDIESLIQHMRQLNFPDKLITAYQ